MAGSGGDGGGRFRFAQVQSLLEIEIEGITVQKWVFEAQKNAAGLLRINHNIYLTTPQLIEKNGYPSEVHEVTTKDGYILTLHRIPYGKNNFQQGQHHHRPVVLLQQGTFCSSSVWVLNSPEKALAFRLADQGYDVWMANSRGTTYSKGHVSLNPKSKEYWNFSFHEMAYYDLPANFDYILNHTQEPDLHYIGHSLGTTIFFAAMTLHPSYNSKVRLMTALAPVAFTENVLSPLAVMAAPFVNQIDRLCQYFGIYQFFPNNPLMHILGATITHPLSPIQGILPNILYLVCGIDREQLDKNLMTALLGHVPAGISAKTLSHFAQGVNSGEFRRYDYGPKQNMVLYNQVTPPIYDLTKITAPVAMYYGNNDWLAAKPDVHRLADNLPNVVRKFLVPFDKFNHMDFLFALSVPALLYTKVEEEMNNYRKKTTNMLMTNTEHYNNNNNHLQQLPVDTLC